MRYLIDTNIISEINKPRPDANVIAWLTGIDQTSMALSIITLAELRFGIESLSSDDAKRGRLLAWLDDEVRPMFEGRTLGLSEDILVAWRELAGVARQQNKTIPQADSLLAATAKHARLVIATRDVEPFLILKLPVLNPFTGERFNGA